MKRTRIILAFVVVLVAVSAYLIFNNSSSTIKKELRDFAIADTARVVKIFLADMKNNEVTLSRADHGKWRLNDSLDVRTDLIFALLQTIHDLEIVAPVPKSGADNIIRQLATSGTKVEIYMKKFRVNIFGWIKMFPYESLEKVYYVGGPTQDHLGTYMIVENSTTPFINFIPGFNGFLSSRYSPKFGDWRARKLFSYRFDQIASVSVEWIAEENESFRVQNNLDKTFTVLPLHSETPPPSIDTIKVLDFITAFYNVNFDEFENGLDPHEIDSVIRSQPSHIVKIKGTDGSEEEIKTFRRENPYIGSPDADSTTSRYDLDRLYALVNNEEFVIIQYFVFDRILKKMSWFTSQGFYEVPEL
ncbi:MAG: DUF4340 domain-containing protein [Bacteroidetes bacterium]|nr:DUF4340 domain-containing protein [Bacteroidota bacterium]MBU1719294.1 DUF4340 domain-containing protein [Bacteroidota bacterium]